MRKRDDEKFCVDSFDEYLRTTVRIHNTSWRRVPRNEDPPDFYLNIGDSLFAVEHTNTEIMRDVTIGSGQIREETYQNTHTQFVKEVKETALAQGILRGAYAISFYKPLTACEFTRIKRKVFKELLAYIRNSTQAENTRRENIFYQNETVCLIEKLHNQSNDVYEVFQDIAWPNSPEFIDKICGMLQNAINTKITKFNKKAETTPKILEIPKILLLLNTETFAGVPTYRNCVQRIDSLNFFHSIFLVSPDGNGTILYTCEDTWV